MASNRLQRRLDILLDEADEALSRFDWEGVRQRAQAVLAIDPDNEEGGAFLASAERALGETASTREAPGASEAATAALPTSFANGRYQVNGFLGEGGKKRVYLAQDTLLDREVAFALVKTEGLDDTARIRITREAQSMGRLGSHPHIVTVFDLGEHDGQPYMVTELMAGGDVEGLIDDAADHRLPLEQAIKIAQETCRGLDFAHGRGIVHRDLKPGNVWLTEEGIAKIGDFGLAVALDRSRITSEGMMVGTVSYMPPEQAMGGEVTPRSDLYSMGAMLYEMVTGRPPFLGDDAVAIIGQHINTPPVAPVWHNPECPRPLEALILRMLAKDPAERPASAADVLAALEAIDLDEPRLSPASSQGDTGGYEEGRALDSLAGDVFVGRQREMGELKACLEDSLSGRGRMVALVGEPGIGKTRTAMELCTYAGLRGAQVLWGRCYEEQGMPPYWPWVQAIRSYVRERDPELVRSEMGAGAPDIAEIVSEVRERLPDLRSPPELDAEQARFRLFDSITDFLKSAASRQPLVLVLDDLQWADKPSLLLLEFLARELANARILVVGTYRDVDLSRQHPLAETLGQLAREQRLQRVLLRGLTQQDVARFIEIASGVKPIQALVEAVHGQTEGNPLFVTEVVRLLVQEGELSPERMATRDSWSVRIPEGVREVIGRRLNRLSQRCNQTLTVASVIGREFGLDQLKRLVQDPSAGEGQAMSEDRLLDVLEEALAARIIQELPQSAGRFQFTHGLIQETLSQELSTARRVRLHHQIGESLEELYGPRLEPHLAELAHHFWEGVQAGDTSKATDYAVRAGDRAVALLAYEEAQHHYQIALQALELEDSVDQGQRCLFLLALGEAQQKAGDYSEAMGSFSQAADIAVALGLPDNLAIAAIGFEDASWRPGLPGAPAVRLLEAAQSAMTEEDSPLLARVSASLARALSFTGLDDQGAVVARQAIDMARRIGDPAVLAFGLRAILYTGRGQPELAQERLNHVNELLKIATEIGDRELALHAYFLRILDLVPLGDIPAVDADIDAASRLAEEARQPHFSYVLAVWTAMRALLDGRLDEAEQLAQEAMAVGQRLQSEGVAGTLGIQMFTVYLVKGRLRELEPLVKVFIEQHSAASAWRPGLAFIYSELGRREEAQAEFEHLAAEGFTDIPRDALWLGCIAYLCEACAFLGDAERAESLYELLLPYAERTVTVGTAAACYGAAARYLGLLSATMSRWEEAQQHFEHALEMNQRMGAKPWLAHTQQQYGDMLLARGQPGDRQKATALLDQALAIASELGMAALLERVLARREILEA
ncbi:MAG: protein kinase [Chloroflexi bacterium]|nr:protein kinase [Chloroflexota bacterium]